MERTPSQSAHKPSDENPSLRMRARFSDSDRAFEIDVYDLTGEEKIAVEEHFNQPWNLLVQNGWLLDSQKGYVFLAYLARRREEPSFTYRDALSFDPKVPEEEGGEEPRPTKDRKKSGR